MNRSAVSEYKFRNANRELLIAGVAVSAVALAFVQPAFTVLALCILLVLAGILRLEFFVDAMIFLLPWQPLLDLQAPFRDPFLLARFALLVIIWTSRRDAAFSWLRENKRLATGVIAFAVIAAASLTSSGQPANVNAYRSLVRLFSYLSAFLAIAGYVQTRDQLKRILELILLSTVAVSLFGFVQAYAQDYTDFYFRLYPLQETALEAWNGRITSFLFHFNSLAGYLNLVLPLSIACFTLSKSRRLRLLGFVCHTLGLAALYLTGSRGGLIAYAGTLLVVVLFIKPGRQSFFKLAVSVVLAMGLAFPLQPKETGAVREVGDFDQQSRLAAWAAAGMMFVNHPVLGVGYGNYRSLYADYIPGARPDELDAHNLYLQLLAETGTIGFAVFCAVLFLFSRKAIQLARAVDPLHRIVAIAGGGAIAATLIHGSVDYLFNVSPQFGTMFWVLPGLLLATANLARDPEMTISLMAEEGALNAQL